MPRNLPKPITHFHGHYRFLSNFDDQYPFQFEGETWPTSEHAFQAGKTRNPGWRVRIQVADTPGEAKALGRDCPLRENWESIKDDHMFQVLKAKFSVPEYREMLLETGNRKLVEGNNHGDAYWGMIRIPGIGWRGKNMLGRLLMVIRDDLRAETEGFGCDHD